MARKATDLLDVFRYGGGGEGGDGGGDERADGGAAGKPRRKADGRSKPKARFEGISLNRRQLVLASSSIGLLLILSFVLGLAAGRPGGEATGSALHRSRETVAIRAHLSAADPATQKGVSPSEVAWQLSNEYRIRPQNLRVRRQGAELVIDIGPFPSREEARSWLRRSGLEMAHIHMEDPFRFPEYVAVRW